MAYLDSAYADQGAANVLPFQMPDQQQPVDAGHQDQTSAEHPHARLIRWIEAENIADELDEDFLNHIGQQVVKEYEIDEDSRRDWLSQNEKAFKLAMQMVEKKTFPWVGASNVIFPLMTVAAVQFAARAYPAIVAGRNVVKGGVLGTDDGTPQMGPDNTPMVQMGQQGPQPVWQVPPGEKRKRADRIAEHMSWQLLDEMEDWEEDTDTLLHVLPIAGCHFRKSYFDPALGCNVSEGVFAENLVINYWAKSMARAPRISEKLWRYPNEIEENIRIGAWLDQDYIAVMGDDDTEKTQPDPSDEDAPVEFIEQHRLLDLDEDGYAEPYIVTVHKVSKKVARIVARYDADGVLIRNGQIVRIKPVHYYTKYDFLPNPEGGIYGIGFGKLLAPINRSVNTVINQLIDAGTLANTPSGFIGRGLSMHTGEVRFKMGSFKVVNAPGSRIRDAIVPIQFKEPSTVLFSLLGMLIEAGKDVASIKDVLTGETNAATMQPTTLMGLIDQGLKVFSAIYKRVHRSCKRELDKLYRLNRIYLEDRSGYLKDEKWQEISREDYGDDVAVFPISDPNQVSNMQKMARAELLRTYQNDPLFDPIEVRKRVLTAAEEPDIDQLLVKQQPQNPQILMAAAELKRKEEESRAQQIKDYAQAVNYLAQADKASVDGDISWAEKQLDFLRLRMEQLNGSQVQQGQSGPQAGNNPGQPSLPSSAQPPMPGAQMAPDGNHYIPDPSRPGKYLQVVGNAAA